MAATSKLGDFSVLTFDCYGTLIDWETGIWDALQPLIARGGANPARREILNVYADIEHGLEQRHPGMRYDEILAKLHAALAERLALPSTAALDEAFANSVAHWPAFPDSASALRRLAAKYRLVILSNVHNAGIAASIRKLGVEFDAAYTAEDIGSYKPAGANFEYLLAHLQSDFGLHKHDVLHTAQSLFHDHEPANRFGLANAWIDRQRLSEGGDRGATAAVAERPRTDFRFFTLGEMADAAAGE